MLYNKREVRKVNDKKVLHKVKKQWVTVSLALLMAIGGGAVATHTSASANEGQGDNSSNDEIARMNKNLEQANAGDNHSKLYDAKNTARIGGDNGTANASTNNQKKPVYYLNPPKNGNQSSPLTSASDDASSAYMDYTSAITNSTNASNAVTSIRDDVTNVNSLSNYLKGLSLNANALPNREYYSDAFNKLNSDSTNVSTKFSDANTNNRSIPGEVSSIANDANGANIAYANAVTDAKNGTVNNTSLNDDINNADDYNRSASNSSLSVHNQSIAIDNDKTSADGIYNDASNVINSVNAAIVSLTSSSINSKINQATTSNDNNVIDSISSDAKSTSNSVINANSLSNSVSSDASLSSDSSASSISNQASIYSNASANTDLSNYASSEAKDKSIINSDLAKISTPNTSASASAADASNKYVNASENSDNYQDLNNDLSAANADSSSVSTNYNEVATLATAISSASADMSNIDSNAQSVLNSLRTSASSVASQNASATSSQNISATSSSDDLSNADPQVNSNNSLVHLLNRNAEAYTNYYPSATSVLNRFSNDAQNDTNIYNQNSASASSAISVVNSANSVAQQERTSALNAYSHGSFSSAYDYEKLVNSAYSVASYEETSATTFTSNAESASSSLTNTTSQAKSTIDGMSQVRVARPNDTSNHDDKSDFDAMVTLHDKQGAYLYVIQGRQNGDVTLNGVTYTDVTANSQTGEVIGNYNNKKYDLNYQASIKDTPRQSTNANVNFEVGFEYDDGNGHKNLDYDHNGLSVDTGKMDSQLKNVFREPNQVSGYKGEPYPVPINDIYDPQANLYPGFTPENKDEKRIVVLGENISGNGDGNNNGDNDNQGYWYGSRENQNTRVLMFSAKRYWTKIAYTYNGKTYYAKYQKPANSDITYGNNDNYSEDQDGNALFAGIAGTKDNQGDLENATSLDYADQLNSANIPTGLQIGNTGEPITFGNDYNQNGNNPYGSLSTQPNGTTNTFTVPLVPSPITINAPIVIENYHDLINNQNQKPAQVFATVPLYGSTYGNQQSYFISRNNINYDNSNEDGTLNGRSLMSVGYMNNMPTLNGRNPEGKWTDIGNTPTGNTKDTAFVPNNGFSRVGGTWADVDVTNGHISKTTAQQDSHVSGNTISEFVPIVYYTPQPAGQYDEDLTVPDMYYTYRFWAPNDRSQQGIQKYSGAYITPNGIHTTSQTNGDGISINSDDINDKYQNYESYYNTQNNYNKPDQNNAYNFKTEQKNMTWDLGLAHALVPSGTIVVQNPYLDDNNLNGYKGEDPNLPENNWAFILLKTSSSINGGNIQLERLSMTNSNTFKTRNGNGDTITYLGLANGSDAKDQTPQTEDPNNPTSSNGFVVSYKGQQQWFPQNTAILWDNNARKFCIYHNATHTSSSQGTPTVTPFPNDQSTPNTSNTWNGYYEFANGTPIHFDIGNDNDNSDTGTTANTGIITSTTDGQYTGTPNTTGAYSQDSFYLGDMNAYAQPMNYGVQFLGSQNYLSYDGSHIEDDLKYPEPAGKDQYGNPVDENKQFYPDFTENEWSFDPTNKTITLSTYNNSDPNSTNTSTSNDTNYYNDLAFANDSITYDANTGQFSINRNNIKGHDNNPIALNFPTYDGQNKSVTPKLVYDADFEQSYLDHLKQSETIGHQINENPNAEPSGHNNTILGYENGDKSKPIYQPTYNSPTLVWTLGTGNPSLNLWPGGEPLNDNTNAVVYLADQQIKAKNEIHFVDLDTGYQFSDQDITGTNNSTMTTLFNNVQNNTKGNKTEFDMAGFLKQVTNQQNSTLQGDGTWKLETKLHNGDDADVYIVRTDSPSDVEPLNNTYIYVSTVDLGDPNNIGKYDFPLVVNYEGVDGSAIDSESALNASQAAMETYAKSNYNSAWSASASDSYVEAQNSYTSAMNSWNNQTSSFRSDNPKSAPVAPVDNPPATSDLGSMAGQHDFLIDGPLGNTVQDAISGLRTTNTSANVSAGSSYATYYTKSSVDPWWQYTEAGYHEVYLIPGPYQSGRDYSLDTSNLNQDQSNQYVTGKPSNLTINSSGGHAVNYTIGEVGHTPVMTVVLAKNPQAQPIYVQTDENGNLLSSSGKPITTNLGGPVTVAGPVDDTGSNVSIAQGTSFYDNGLSLSDYNSANNVVSSEVNSSYDTKSVDIDQEHDTPYPVYVTAPGIKVHYRIAGNNHDLNRDIYFSNPMPKTPFNVNNYDGQNWDDLSNLQANKGTLNSNNLPQNLSSQFDNEHYSVVATVGDKVAGKNGQTTSAVPTSFGYHQENVYIYLEPKAYAQVHFIDDTAKDGVKDPNDANLSKYDPQSLMTTSGSSVAYDPTASLNALYASGYQLDSNPVNAGSNSNGSNQISFSYGNSYTNSNPYVYNIYVEHKSTAKSSGASVNEEIHYSFATSANGSSLNDSESMATAKHSLPSSYRNSVSYDESYNIDGIEHSNYDFRWSSNGSFSNVSVPSISGWHATITSFNGASYGSYNNDSSVAAPKISYRNTNSSYSGASFTAASASMSSGIYNYSYDVTYYPDSYSDYASATDVVTYKYLNSNGTLSWSNSSENGSALSYHRSENWLSDSSANAYSATSWSASGASSFASIKPSASVSVSGHWYHLVANSTSSDVPSIAKITNGLKSNSNEPFSNVVTYQEDRLSNYVNNASGTATIVYHWENESDSVIPTSNSSKPAGNVSYSQSYTSDMNWTGGSSSDWAWSSSADIQFDNSAASESGSHISSAYSGYIPRISNSNEPSAGTMNYSEVENIYYIPDSYTTSGQTSQSARGNVTVNYYLNGTTTSVAKPFTSSSAITYTRTVYSDATSGKAGSNYYSYGPWSSNNSVSNIIPTSSSASTQADNYHLINRNVVTSTLPSLSSVKAGSTYNYVENVYFDADSFGSTTDIVSATNTVQYLISGETDKSLMSPSSSTIKFSRADSYDTYSSGNVNHHRNHSYGSWTSSSAFASDSAPSDISYNGHHYHIVNPNNVDSVAGMTPSLTSSDVTSIYTSANPNGGSGNTGSWSSSENIYYALDSTGDYVLSGAQTATGKMTISYLNQQNTNKSVANTSTYSVTYSRSQYQDKHSMGSSANSYGPWTANSSLSVPASPNVQYYHLASVSGSDRISNGLPKGFNNGSATLSNGGSYAYSETVYYTSDNASLSAENATVTETIDYIINGSKASSAVQTVSYTRSAMYDPHTKMYTPTGKWSAKSSFSLPKSYSSAGWHTANSLTSAEISVDPNKFSLASGKNTFSSSASFKVNYKNYKQNLSPEPFIPILPNKKPSTKKPTAPHKPASNKPNVPTKPSQPTDAKINQDINNHHVTPTDVTHMNKKQLKKAKRNDPNQYPKILKEYNQAKKASKAKRNRSRHNGKVNVPKPKKSTNKHQVKKPIRKTARTIQKSKGNNRKPSKSMKSAHKSAAKPNHRTQKTVNKAIKKTATNQLHHLKQTRPKAYNKVAKGSQKIVQQIAKQPTNTRVYRDVMKQTARTVTPQEMQYLAVHNPAVYRKILAEQDMLGISSIHRAARTITPQSMAYLRTHNPKLYRKILAEQDMLGIGHIMSHGHNGAKKSRGKLPQTSESANHSGVIATVLMALGMIFRIPALKRKKHHNE